MYNIQCTTYDLYDVRLMFTMSSLTKMLLYLHLRQNKTHSKYSIHNILYTIVYVHCTLYSLYINSTLYTLHCTLYRIQFTVPVYSVRIHCTVYSVAMSHSICTYTVRPTILPCLGPQFRLLY